MFLGTNVLNVPQGKPVVFFDFDGVLNWEGTSPNQRKKLEDAPGYWQRSSVYAEPPENAQGGWRGSGSWFNVRWSAELVQKLNRLKENPGFTWVWFNNLVV